MRKNIWDIYAPFYTRVMRGERKMYAFLYRRISQWVQGKEVLELATGPGLIAKEIAPFAKSVLATDYSTGMIAEARKGDCPPNLRFAVADAQSLPYRDRSFDVVIIANALHLVPDPERVLQEIARVLRPGGLLIAPNFMRQKISRPSKLWAGVLRLIGVPFVHQWTAETYLAFLRQNGWDVVFAKEILVRMPLLYAECRRR